MKKSHRVKVTSPRPPTVHTVRSLTDSERNISLNLNQTDKASAQSKSEADTVAVNTSQTGSTERNPDRQLIIVPGREEGEGRQSSLEIRSEIHIKTQHIILACRERV